MTSNDQTKQTQRARLYLTLGIVIVGFLVGSFILWFQRMSHMPPTSTSPDGTLQINIPTVQYPTISPSAPEFTVSIHSVGNSGITGTATFKDIAGVVAILLQVDGLPTDEEHESIVPAELRYGTCAAPGDLAYPMTAPDAGQSETDLSINLKEFNTQKPLAILLYRSAQDHTVIGCGDVQ